MEKKNGKLYLIHRAVPSFDATTMEKELAKYFRKLEFCLTDLGGIDAAIRGAKRLQEEIRRDRPRLRPVEIEFKYRDSTYAGACQFIEFGRSCVALEEVRFFVTEEKLKELC